MRSEQGFALIIVLWTLVLVTLMVTQMIGAARSETQLAGNVKTRAVVQATADGAVYSAVFHVLDQSPLHWMADGRPHIVRDGGLVVTIRIESEAGKINPNSAPAGLLNALLRRVGADRQTAALIAAAMIAWRSPLEPIASQISLYRAAGHSYAPPAAPFQSLDEVGLVLGMTPGLLARLAPHLSLYHDGEPDAVDADPVVSAAIADWSGAPPPANNRRPDDSVVVITANADGAGGVRATRRAIVQIAVTPGRQPFRLLVWQ